MAIQTFMHYIQEAAKKTPPPTTSKISATEWEYCIAAAFNNARTTVPSSMDPDVFADKFASRHSISLVKYLSVKDTAQKIAKTIRTQLKIAGTADYRMESTGASSGEMIEWWDGKNTPKTDLYTFKSHSTDTKSSIKLSLKKEGGSQYMSAMKGEALSTFKAATLFMDKSGKSKSTADDIMKVVEKKLTSRFESTLSIDFLTKFAQDYKGDVGKVAPSPARKKAIQKELPKEVPFGKKMIKTPSVDDILKEVNRHIRWKDFISSANPEIGHWFSVNEDFKTWFVFEAATGRMKFEPDEKASATHVLVFDTTTGEHSIVHALEEPVTLGKLKFSPSSYVKKEASRAIIRISPKTPDGKSGRSPAGFRVVSPALRKKEKELQLSAVDLQEASADPIDDFIEREFLHIIMADSAVKESLAESDLKEINWNDMKSAVGHVWAGLTKWFEKVDVAAIVKKLTEWITTLFKRLVEHMKELAQKGLTLFLNFVGFEPDVQEVSTNVADFLAS